MAFKIKVNSKGKKTKRKICPKGQKLVNGSCQVVKAKEKLNRKKGSKRAVRNKRNQGASLLRKMGRLTKRANKKRASMGLNKR